MMMMAIFGCQVWLDDRQQSVFTLNKTVFWYAICNFYFLQYNYNSFNNAINLYEIKLWKNDNLQVS
jgi:hypothetical protein